MVELGKGRSVREIRAPNMQGGRTQTISSAINPHHTRVAEHKAVSSPEIRQDVARVGIKHQSEQHSVVLVGAELNMNAGIVEPGRT